MFVWGSLAKDLARHGADASIAGIAYDVLGAR
jgi:hypothetical protein